MVTYLFKIKLAAISMKKENSFPSLIKPSFAISKAKRPNPAPGTSTFVFVRSLLTNKNRLIYIQITLQKIYKWV